MAYKVGVREGSNAARSGVAWLIASVLLVWPALWNRYPLLFPDSIAYLDQGVPVARAIFLHHFSHYYGVRSLIYSLLLLLFHLHRFIWGALIPQALCTLCALWYTVRLFLGRDHLQRSFVCIVFTLSLLTSLPWFVSFVMPDVLGGDVYLAMIVLSLAEDGALTRAEGFLLGGIAAIGIASHTTHLILAALLGCFLVAARLHRSGPRKAVSAGLRVACVLIAASACTLALNGYLYGKLSFNGDRPPFLMARLLADGPAREYLKKNCTTLSWAICEDVAHLPETDDDFLWDENGIWSRADAVKQRRLLQEEVPLAVATLRYETWEQVRVSAESFLNQLVCVGYSDFDESDYVRQNLSPAFYESAQKYAHSMQAQQRVPFDLLNAVTRATLLASLALIGYLGFYRGLLRDFQLSVFTAAVFGLLVCNAALTGVLSEVDDRYQARIVWMVPLLVLILIARLPPKRSGGEMGHDRLSGAVSSHNSTVGISQLLHANQL